MNQSIFNMDRAIRSRVLVTLPSLVKIVSAVAPPTWWSNILVDCPLLLLLLLIEKTYQFINDVNGVSRSHKTANIFFSFDLVA